MKTITLSNGMVASLDDEDCQRYGTLRWFAGGGKNHWYAARFTAGPDGGRRTVYLHRLIMGHIDAGSEVDHIDGDTLNNTRANLRLVSHRDNLRNRRSSCSNTGHRNVYRTRSGTYEVKLCPDTGRIRVGRFRALDDAVAAAHAARLQYYGAH